MLKSGRIAAAALSGAAFSFAIPSISFAQMSGPDSAWYAGASIGQSDIKFSCAGASPCDTKDTAWRILGGYQINRNFAAELGYHDFGKATFGPDDIKANAIELVGLGAWPFTREFSVYGKAGFFRGEAKGAGVKETNTDLTYGAGLQYNFTPQLGLRGEWQRYSNMGGGDFGEKADVDVISLGVIFKFK